MDNRKKELISKYLSGDVTPQEFWEVERLLKEDAEFLRRFEITKGISKMQQTAFEKQANAEIEDYQEQIREPRITPPLVSIKTKTVFWNFQRIAVSMAAGLAIAFTLYWFLMKDHSQSTELIATLSAVEKVDEVSNDGKGFSSSDTSNHITGSVVVQLFKSDTIEANITKYIYVRDFDIPEADTLKIYFAESNKQDEWKNAKELTIMYNEHNDLYDLMIDNKKKYSIKTNTLDTLK